HHGDVVLHAALTGALAGLGGLLGDGLVREDADPDLAAALHVTGDGDTSRLDLAAGEPARLERHEAELAKGEVRASVRHAAGAALLHLAVLGACRLKHDVPRLLAGAAAGRQHLATEDPNLDADLAVGGLGLGETVVDVGAERVERHPTL